MWRFHLLVLFIIWLLKTVKPQSSAPEVEKDLNSDINLKIKMISTDTIQFTITYSSVGWVGIGLGTRMAGADIITVEANGDDGVMKDRHALRNGIEPPLDTVNNWVLKTVRNGSKNIYFITRKLNTGDTEDNIIVNGTNNMIFAYGPTSTIKYHTSARRSPFSMTIDVYTGVISTGEGILTIDNSNINRHGIMMYVAWGWLSIDSQW